MKREMSIKNKNLILILSFLAVIICLILTALLFYTAKPSLLITLSFIVGLVSGVCITLLIHNLLNKKF